MPQDPTAAPNSPGPSPSVTPHEPASAGANRSVVVPGYEVLDELGRGGMGIVFRARQVKLDRPVALKMVLSGDLAGPSELHRFRAEAVALLCVESLGLDGAEYCRGYLQHWLRGQTIPETSAQRVFKVEGPDYAIFRGVNRQIDNTHTAMTYR